MEENKNEDNTEDEVNSETGEGTKETLMKVVPTKEKTINNFLKSHYKDVEGNAIFKYCYTPINGVRQVVVDEENKLEARLICNDFKKELVNYMAKETAEKTVIDYAQTKEKMEQENYEP
jgi:hypothetical protein